MLAFFLPLFLLFLMIGLPVFFGLLAAPGLLLWLNDQQRDLALLYRNVYNGMDSFPLMLCRRVTSRYEPTASANDSEDKAFCT